MESLVPGLLRDLTAYAQAQVASGLAAEALRIVEADAPDLVAAYRLGFLPLNYREALPPSARPLLAGRRIAGCLWLPATDANGVVVDALAIHPRPSGGAYVRWCDQPQGMLGATIASSFPDLIVSDNLRFVGRCFRRGLRNTLLLRSPVDAAQVADHLIAAGVRRVDVRVRSNATDYADALRIAGLVVQVSSSVLDAGAGYFVTAATPLPPESAPDTDPHAVVVEDATPSSSAPTAAVDGVSECLALVQHDRRHGIATFRVGAVTYVIDAPTDGRTLLDVTVRCVGAVQRDCFDVAVPAARACFAGVAAGRCGLPEAVILGHLVDLLERVRLLAETDATVSRPVQSLPFTPDAAVVRDWLAAPDLLDRIAVDLNALGWVGEDAAKRLAYLVSISRKVPTPLWCQRLMPPGVAASGIDLIAELTPPEDVVRVSRLTAAMLDRQEPDALRHALLVIDDGATIADDAILALRILHTRGALAGVQPRMPGAGSSRPAVCDVRGPIALLTASTRRLDETLTATCISLPLDDSPAQTIRVIATQGRAYTDQGRAGGAADATRQTIRARHHAFQRGLVCRPVVIACADRIEFPAHTVQDRRDHALFLGIVAAHALLHQHQRPSDGAAVVADERDVTAAITLAAAANIGTERGMSSAAGDLLVSWWRLGHTELTVRDVLDLRGDWTPYTARGALAELTAAGHVAVAAGGGQGRRCVFRLQATAPTQAPSGSRIRLLSSAAAPIAVHDDASLLKLEKLAKSISPESLCG